MAVDKDTAELVAFEEHLDVYGSRVERWAEEARERFEPLLERSARARELLAESRALERLLDQAPLPDAHRMQALTDRIAAFAAAEANNRPASASVIDLAARRQSRLPTRSLGWKIASALAASLLVGIFIGASSPVTTAVETLASAVGLPGEIEGADLVQIYDAAADEEDFL